MKATICLSAVLLVFTACIGWNADQREVVDSYSEVSDLAEAGNWRRLIASFDSETEELIENLTGLYTESGAPFQGNPDAFMEALAMDTDLFRFPESVLSVEITGSLAVLTAEESGATAQFRFTRESGEWKLNYVTRVTGLFQSAMEGVANEPEYPGEVIPSVITVDQGPCPIVVRNGLEGLAIHNAFCTRSSNDSWGTDLLGPNILGTGSELVMGVEEGTWDIQLFDSSQRPYSLWGIEVDQNGVLWEVTESDLDQAE